MRRSLQALTGAQLSSTLAKVMHVGTRLQLFRCGLAWFKKMRASEHVLHVGIVCRFSSMAQTLMLQGPHPCHIKQPLFSCSVLPLPLAAVFAYLAHAICANCC